MLTITFRLLSHQCFFSFPLRQGEVEVVIFVVFLVEEEESTINNSLSLSKSGSLSLSQSTYIFFGCEIKRRRDIYSKGMK
jgi:hypothetical protein